MHKSTQEFSCTNNKLRNSDITSEEAVTELPVTYTDDELGVMIDQILKDSDFDNDGFIDYSEFKASEMKS
ncbi:hypothetical protein C0J52_22735 [Blattella germanica]|nr:hypothetical protein C0J52_22735 [Blattella germanica]